MSSPSFQHRDQAGLPWGGQAGTRGSQLCVQHGARRPEGILSGQGGLPTVPGWGVGGKERLQRTGGRAGMRPLTKSRVALEPSSLCPRRPPAPGGQGVVSVGPCCSAGTYRRCFRKPWGGVTESYRPECQFLPAQEPLPGQVWFPNSGCSVSPQPPSKSPLTSP